MDEAGYVLMIRIIAIITLLFSGSVVATIAFFPQMRMKLFFQCILWMSIADMGTAVVSIIGFPDAGSVCVIQGLAAVFFPVASWCWTTLLSYSIYSIIRYERVQVNIYVCHTFCWSLSAACAFLPLINAQYSPPNPSYQWCVIAARSNSPSWAVQFWAIASFFGWFVLFVVLMLIWSLIIFHRLVWQRTVATAIVYRIYRKLWLYPVAVFCCWTINFVVLEFSNESTPGLVFTSMVFGLSNGIWSAIIFFMKSTEARSRWMNLLYPTKATQELSTVSGVRQTTIHTTNHMQPQVSSLCLDSEFATNRTTLSYLMSYRQSENPLVSRRGVISARYSIKPCIIEDFDIEDDGDGQALVCVSDNGSISSTFASENPIITKGDSGLELQLSSASRFTIASSEGDSSVRIRASDPEGQVANAVMHSDCESNNQNNPNY